MKETSGLIIQALYKSANQIQHNPPMYKRAKFYPNTIYEMTIFPKDLLRLELSPNCAISYGYHHTYRFVYPFVKPHDTHKLVFHTTESEANYVHEILNILHHNVQKNSDDQDFLILGLENDDIWEREIATYVLYLGGKIKIRPKTRSIATFVTSVGTIRIQFSIGYEPTVIYDNRIYDTNLQNALQQTAYWKEASGLLYRLNELLYGRHRIQ